MKRKQNIFFKIILVVIGLTLVVDSTSCWGQILSSQLKSQILQKYNLQSTENPVLQSIFEKVLYQEKFNVKEITSGQKHKVRISPITTFFVRDKNGQLKSIIYTNKFLYPAEARSIQLSLEDQLEAIFRFRTLFGKIEKEVRVKFFPDSSKFQKDNHLFYLCGELSSKEIKKDLEYIKEKLLSQNLVSSSQSVKLSELVNKEFYFIPKIKSKDVFILKRQTIKGIPPQDNYADCFFIGVNLSLIVVYDTLGDIVGVYKIRRGGENLSLSSFVFKMDGLDYTRVVYDTKGLQQKEKVKLHFPYRAP